MALGAWLQAPDGQRHEISQALPGAGDNNEAEAHALQALLEAAQALGVRRLQVFSDSDLVVRAARAPLPEAPALAPLFTRIRALLGGFEQASVSWLPQRRNMHADALARAALGLPPRAPAATRQRRRRK